MKSKTIFYLLFFFLVPVNIIIAQGVPTFDDDVDDGIAVPIDQYIYPILLTFLIVGIAFFCYNYLKTLRKV